MYTCSINRGIDEGKVVTKRILYRALNSTCRRNPQPFAYHRFFFFNFPSMAIDNCSAFYILTESSSVVIVLETLTFTLTLFELLKKKSSMMPYNKWDFIRSYPFVRVASVVASSSGGEGYSHIWAR